MLLVQIRLEEAQLQAALAVDTADFPLQRDALAETPEIVFRQSRLPDQLGAGRIPDAHGHLTAALFGHRHNDIDFTDIVGDLIKWPHFIEQSQIVHAGHVALKLLFIQNVANI